MTNEYNYMNIKLMTSSLHNSEEGHVYDFMYVTVYSTVADVEGHTQK